MLQKYSLILEKTEILEKSLEYFACPAEVTYVHVTVFLNIHLPTET